MGTHESIVRRAFVNHRLSNRSDSSQPIQGSVERAIEQSEERFNRYKQVHVESLAAILLRKGR